MLVLLLLLNEYALSVQQVGLLEIELDALFVLTMLVDFVFVVDMVLQFVTMYPRTTARGLEWELRPQKIAKNYLRTEGRKADTLAR